MTLERLELFFDKLLYTLHIFSNFVQLSASVKLKYRSTGDHILFVIGELFSLNAFLELEKQNAL